MSSTCMLRLPLPATQGCALVWIFYANIDFKVVRIAFSRPLHQAVPCSAANGAL